MSNKLSKADFLKRYLENDDQKKVKKKRQKVGKSSNRMKIFNEDIDLKSMKFDQQVEVEEDDAPMVAEVIDERPVDVQVKELYESSRWKKLDSSDDRHFTEKGSTSSKSTLKSSKHPAFADTHRNQPTKKQHGSDIDASPLRQSRTKRHDSDSDASPRRKNCLSNEISHPSATHRQSASKAETLSSESDISPPRKGENLQTSSKRHGSSTHHQQSSSKDKRHDSESDNSPPRKGEKQQTSSKTHGSGAHHRQSSSKVQRHDSESDNSPPRKGENQQTSSKTHGSGTHHRQSSFKVKRHDSESDNSPPRKRDERLSNSRAIRHDSDDDDDSLHRKSDHRRSKRHDSGSDSDPHSKNGRNERRNRLSSNANRHGSDSDISPPRCRIDPKRSDPKPISRAKPRQYDSDLSPERLNATSRNRKVDSDGDFSPPREPRSLKDNGARPSKTLSGLKAGLQSSATLKEETRDLRERENRHINQLDDDLSGRNASTVLRDRRTGMRRDLEEEQLAQEKIDRRKQEHQQKYSEWGKGIEQTEGRRNRLEADLHEMAKPLARYSDDADLDAQLKSVIHEDDPMAEYMKKKKQKEVSSVMPQYKGPPAPPNRFGIKPGFRWDGVDRSNGFEKKYFDKHTNSKASEEEAYLWSVQNM